MNVVLDPVKNLLGGGTLSVWLIVGGVIFLWLATKMVKMAMRVVVLSISATMLLSAAPWASDGIDAPAGNCALAAVQDAMNTVEGLAAKRVTIEEVSPDATCNSTSDGLAAGTAKAKLRTVFDIPFQEYAVSPSGAVARLDIPDRPGG